MKNIYVILLLFFPYFFQAQITITASDMPQPGDEWTDINCEIPNNFSIGSPGANQTYDFSNLVPEDTFSTVFVAPSSTPGVSEFPDATIATEVDDDEEFYAYYQQTNDELLLLGFYADTSVSGTGQYLTSRFAPPNKAFQIPSTYNTSFSDMSTLSITYAGEPGFVDSIRSTITTEDEVLFDGYGTITTPDGTFSCLRERTYSTSTTTSETYSAMTGIWTVVFTNTLIDTIYNWYGEDNLALASVSFFEGEILDISYGISEGVVVVPGADFSASNQGAGVFNFNDNSTNSPTSWAWDFGDGNTSTMQNPSHTYAAAGTYNVCLTATNSAGSNTFCFDVVVVFIPVSDFSFGTPANGVVSFTDASTNNPTSWLWDFGDGNTSTEQNPTHTFAVSGTYNVCLTATNAGGSNMICETITIVITSTDDLANLVKLEIFPNPANTFFNLRLENSNRESLDFYLINALGQIVKSQQVESIGDYQVSVGNLNTGMYYYILKDKEGVIRNRGTLAID